MSSRSPPALPTGLAAFWLGPGELRSHYEDWEVLNFNSRVVSTAAKDDRGRPFKQPVDELVARELIGVQTGLVH